jgi:TorA maturation chaperone TorD
MTVNSAEEKGNLLKAYSMMLYFAGIMTLYEPNEECIREFWTGGMLRNLPVMSRNPLFLSAAADLRDSCDDPELCINDIQEDYLHLFTGTTRMLAPPYESVHLSKEHLMFDKQTLEVREFYNTYGWKFALEGNVPDDHIGTEILFVNLMIEKFLELDDEACRREMRNEIGRFINRHPLNWAAKWKDMVVANSSTSCFKGIAKLVVASLEDIDEVIRNWD